MRNISRGLLFCVLSLVLIGQGRDAWAAVYYVDSAAGSDSYDGLSGAWTSDANGPWASIAKVIPSLSYKEVAKKMVEKLGAKLPQEVVEKNREALKRGYDAF